MFAKVVTKRLLSFFTAQCYAERGYATVSRLSVCPSVCRSVRDVLVCFSHRLEYFENNFTAD